MTLILKWPTIVLLTRPVGESYEICRTLCWRVCNDGQHDISIRLRTRWRKWVRLMTLKNSIAGLMVGFTLSAALSPASAAEPTKAALRKVAATYYKCNVDAKPREAAAFVVDRTTARTIYKSLEQAMDPVCRKGEVFKYLETLRGNIDLIRYGVASALVRHDYLTTFPQGIASAPPLAHEPRPLDELAIRDSARFQRYGPKVLEEEKQKKSIFDFLERFGDCVVRRNPAAAHRFLVTEIGSRDEVVALAGVRPSLAACLPAERTANFDLDMMRGAMADNFIRLARSAPSASSKGR